MRERQLDKLRADLTPDRGAGISAGKTIVIAGMVAFAYSSYAMVSEQIGYQGCPQFRGGSIIIGWCGQPSLLTAYLLISMTTIVLGTLLFMLATSSKSSGRRGGTKIAVQIFLAAFAIILLALNVLMIVNNFHVDYYG